MIVPPRHAHGDLTSLAPHERLPEILVVPRESQEGCQGPSRPSGRNRGLPLRRRRGQGPHLAAKLISRRTCELPPPLAEHRDHGKGAPRVLGEPYRGHNRTETLSSASAPSPHSASSIFILLETSPRRPDHRSDFPSFQPTGPTHVSGALVVTSPSGSQPPLDALMAEVYAFCRGP